MVRNLPANVGDTRDVGLIPGSGRSPERGNGNPLQCSCLENPRDRGAWWATVHGVATRWTQLKRLSMHAYIYIQRSICSLPFFFGINRNHFDVWNTLTRASFQHPVIFCTLFFYLRNCLVQLSSP